MKRKLGITAAVLSISAFLLGGCATQDGTNAQSGAEVTATQQAADEAEPKRANAEFGGTYHWENGISISVSEPAKTSGARPAAQPGHETLKFLVSIENRSQEPFDPNLSTFSITADGTLGEQVYNPAKGIGNTPELVIEPGVTGTFLVGFNVTNQTDMAFEVTPGNSTGDAIIFTK